MSTTYKIDRFELHRDTLLLSALLVNTQLLLFLAYHLLSPNDITGVTPVAVPLVWITVGAWALVRTERPTASQRQRTVGVAVAAAYFGILGYFGGVWGPGADMLPAGIDLAVASAPPGWAPRVFVNLPANGFALGSLQFPFQGVRINLIPWQVVGYVALAYLVYAAVVDAAGSAISGIVGLLSCVSCTWPVIATIATSVFGGSAAVAGAVYDQSYLLSTVVFVATVALLYWRPGWR
ncbi:hypothetical protein SAMN05216559_2814 [Halomicrobium zhouii]|uniref:Uncharacterized protein n=1 Tax=Halomicrobium zhouii TaxID=767519 RepID=A0A1I6LJL0_9EURY|nr:hypothetical protein [Halomicrobium zhouii]SFS03654.1 hypothetical protein SAMN05216559_2814 [Halomicrobium zhouii]